MLMVAIEKKLKLLEKNVILEEKKFEIASASEEAKMLTLKTRDLDDDVRMTVQSVCHMTLKRTKDQPRRRQW